MAERCKYKLEDIVDVNGPAFAVRNYLEQADVRRVLAECAVKTRIHHACEIGCGFGRMTQVLTEFCNSVDGFEREEEFVSIARSLIPAVSFHNVPSLDQLGQPDDHYDFILTFTVLQHLSDSAVARVIDEIRRIARPGGYVLLCEESYPALRSGDIANLDGFFTIGRSIGQYTELMRPFRLVKTFPRRIEPTYARKDVGTYMLFRKPKGSFWLRQFR